MTFTPEEITAMAKEARIGEMGLNIDGSVHLHALFTRFAALVAEKAAAEEREAIAEEWHQRMCSDLEYGVRWVNDREAALFNEKYPQSAGFAAWLGARGQKE